jgi:simple sugar transport system ATP-binding protein
MSAASFATHGEVTCTCDVALELRQVSKRFGRVQANSAVDLKVRAGEIRGLVGENGAGKSTLMAIASGLYSPDAGHVAVNGVVHELKGRDDAIALGINMVHQHFMLVPNCTVAQNVVLGEPGSLFLRLRNVEEKVRTLAEHYGLDVDPTARVDSLTPTERQRAEILTALWRGKTLLILDEPTSVLGPEDVGDLFGIMRRVAAEGCAVVFTSHKLREVVEVCDTISVMRHGEMKTTIARDDVDIDSLATLMVGEALATRVDPSLLGLEDDEAEAAGATIKATGAPVLRLVDEPDDRGVAALGQLTVAAGEIVGVAGVEGNGQRALAEALAGLSHNDGCRVEFAGVDISELGPMERSALGIAYVPEDPLENALIASFPVTWNLALRDYRTAALRSRRGFLNFGALRERATRTIESFDIRGAAEDTRTAALSGGNRQKVVLARELAKNPKLLIVVDPTVGLDVGAAQSVHKALRTQRDRGAAIVLISTDLDEIEELSDRVAVLYRGSIVGVVDDAASQRRQLGLMMTGLSESKRVLGGGTRDVA